MKKGIITTLTLLSLASVALPASAEETRVRVNGVVPAKVRVTEAKERMDNRLASSTERVREVEERAKARIASTTLRIKEMRSEMDVRKASSTERRIEMQQGLAKRLAENTGRVLTATVTRLEKIAERVATRIEKVKAGGGDTTEAESYLAEARTHLSDAKQSIASFSSVDLSADKAKENFQKVREIAGTVKVHVKAAHESLKDATKSLKGPKTGDDDDKTATSTSAQ